MKYRMRENSLTSSITKYKNSQKSESLQLHNYRLGEQVKSVELADFSVQVKVSLLRKRHPLLLTDFSTFLVTVQLQFYYSEKGNCLLPTLYRLKVAANLRFLKLEG